MTIRNVLGALVLGVFVASVAVAEDSPALVFNNAMSNANKRLSKAGYNFGVTLAPIFNGTEFDGKKAKEQLDEIKEVLDQVNNDMKALRIPDSDEARALYEAHQQFLKGQKKMLRNEFADLLEIASDDTLTNEAKKQKLGEILEEVGKIEKKDLTRLQEAQRAFGKRHNIIIEDAEGE
ncbi:MAG: hypothetical protein KDA66_04040 [Planctomycetaceae bacterium]|nr:hypothetical protein [Planctomycetaceae bacterium]